MRTTNRRLQQQYNLMRGERNRAIGERNRAKASVMNRLFQQIAALRIQVQWFRIRQLNLPPPPLNHPQNTIWLPLV
ncbi:hypothetical protein RIR_jg27871.t4 [Rhizophagus irregularis DAOM 181602=DAOM 197198]|nr:hypothetical protein RIR_jg37213.t1 [Rhizophagus irregularis DAOM 181602=DAOM 197198]GET56654.1 hypothetical protein RIR_jg27871.t4 [Rhizophagus irregularis DAOM 181602=DAOM 197198]